MDSRIFVGNLAWQTGWQDLKDHVKAAGFTPVRADVFSDGNGRSKGVGIVEFANPEDAKNAIAQLHDTELHGRKIFVREDREGPRREDGPAGGRGGRGGFGGRGRGRFNDGEGGFRGRGRGRFNDGEGGFGGRGRGRFGGDGDFGGRGRGRFGGDGDFGGRGRGGRGRFGGDNEGGYGGRGFGRRGRGGF